jgi:hypothetical protein
LKIRLHAAEYVRYFLRVFWRILAASALFSSATPLDLQVELREVLTSVPHDLVLSLLLIPKESIFKHLEAQIKRPSRIYIKIWLQFIWLPVFPFPFQVAFCQLSPRVLGVLVSFSVSVIVVPLLELFDVLQPRLLWQLFLLDDVDVLLECPM